MYFFCYDENKKAVLFWADLLTYYFKHRTDGREERVKEMRPKKWII